MIFAGLAVPKSPFKINVESPVDVSKVQVRGLPQSKSVQIRVDTRKPAISTTKSRCEIALGSLLTGGGRLMQFSTIYCCISQTVHLILNVNRKSYVVYIVLFGDLQ